MKSKNQGSAEAAKNESPELMVSITKIASRLEVLEKKMDLLISQTSTRSFEGREHSKPVPVPFVSPPSFRQSITPVRSNEVKPVQGSVPVQAQAKNHERRERMLHKAICADCHKDCEVPFKPTGERPVYCKECFSKRKSGNLSRGSQANGQESQISEVTGPVNPSQRKVVVTKKGVGKVTISEIVRSTSRDISSKRKSNPPPKKSKNNDGF